jgi:hypothetical protein
LQSEAAITARMPINVPHVTHSIKGKSRLHMHGGSSITTVMGNARVSILKTIGILPTRPGSHIPVPLGLHHPKRFTPKGLKFMPCGLRRHGRDFMQRICQGGQAYNIDQFGYVKAIQTLC